MFSIGMCRNSVAALLLTMFAIPSFSQSFMVQCPSSTPSHPAPPASPGDPPYKGPSSEPPYTGRLSPAKPPHRRVS